MNPAIVAGLAGRMSIPPGEFVHPVKAESEARSDAKVASAAANRPEKIRVVFGVHRQKLTVGRDDLRGEQAVDRHSKLADEVADAAAQGEPAKSHRSGIAEPRRQAVNRCGRRVRAGGEAGLDPGRASFDVEVQRAHLPQVENEAPFRKTVAGEAMPAAPDGQFD
jgi:hypothetical protein